NCLAGARARTGAMRLRRLLRRRRPRPVQVLVRFLPALAAAAETRGQSHDHQHATDPAGHRRDLRGENAASRPLGRLAAGGSTDYGFFSVVAVVVFVVPLELPLLQPIDANRPSRHTNPTSFFIGTPFLAS